MNSPLHAHANLEYTEDFSSLICSSKYRAEAREQFQKMKQLEESQTYTCTDYLCESHNALNPLESSVNEECRVTMTEWCYQVIDYAKLHRETVTIAMRLLDRFLSCNTHDAKEVLASRNLYQLATMSALFIAIKTNERTIVTTTEFAQLSRGRFEASDVVRMESVILKDLEWRISAPTTHSFLRYIVAMLPTDLQHTIVSSQVFTELCNFQLDLSAGDYSFVTEKPSVTAVAALLNAYANAKNSDAFNMTSSFDYSSFSTEITRVTGIETHSVVVQEALLRLVTLVKNNGVQFLLPSQIVMMERLSPKFTRDLSPVCVALI
jgi:hypothetical protein